MNVLVLLRATSEMYEQFSPNCCKRDLVFAAVEIEGFANKSLCNVLVTWAMSAFHMWRSFKKLFKWQNFLRIFKVL